MVTINQHQGEWMKIRCSCGNIGSLPRKYILLRCLLGNGRYYWKCPQCQKTTCLRTIAHIVRDSLDEKEKQLNKIKTSRRIWENG